MEIRSQKEVTFTLTMNEREAKLLACLVGALSPLTAEEIIKNGFYFEEWIGKLENREVIEFTGIIYDSLYELF